MAYLITLVVRNCFRLQSTYIFLIAQPQQQTVRIAFKIQERNVILIQLCLNIYLRELSLFIVLLI